MGISLDRISNMAIAFDSTATANQASGATLTFSHTCSGSDRILLVGVVTEIASPDIVTGVTYNGVAMTQLGKVFSGDLDEVYLYALIAPATGANNVVISVSNALAFTYGGSVSYTGAYQDALPTGGDIVTGSTSGASTLSLSGLTPSTANSWIVGVADNQSSNTTLSSSGTLRQAGRPQVVFDTNAIVSGAYTAQFANAGGNTFWGAVECAIAPSPETARASFLYNFA
jgi:hypothetical protein